ncbi:MAG: Crp/Fnr family transcriptional regulator [Rhodospirillaceae bacterium]
MKTVGDTLAFHLSLIGELSDADCTILSDAPATVRTVRRGTDVLSEGEIPHDAVIVLSGLLQRYTARKDGTRQVHSFYVPTDAPSLETLYMDYMDNSLCAAVDSTVGLIPHAHLYELIDKRPGIRKLLWRQTLVQAAVFREWLMRNSRLPAHACVAHLFCEIFVRSQAARLTTDHTFPFPITQEQLSEAVGLSPVHTNRTIMLLRDANAIEWQGGRVSVKDWDKLSAIAEFDAYYLHLRSLPAHAVARGRGRHPEDERGDMRPPARVWHRATFCGAIEQVFVCHLRSQVSSFTRTEPRHGGQASLKVG